MLVVSQFTLAADGRKGRRPLVRPAAPPEVAEPLYEAFCGYLRELGVHVETGRFRAETTVDVSGDGPVTFVLDEPFMWNVASFRPSLRAGARQRGLA